MKPSEINEIHYHNPCVDGLGAAMVANLYAKIHNLTFNFVPSTPQRTNIDDTQGKNVLLLDVTYKHPVMISMLSKSSNLLILDHHKGADEDLIDIPTHNKLFDNKHSGAYLAWQYFFPDQPIPLLIQYIQDRDLWTKIFADVDDFAAYSFVLGKHHNNLSQEDIIKNLEELEKLLDDNVLRQAINEGRAYSRLNDYYVDQLAYSANMTFIQLNDGTFYLVMNAVSNLSALTSNLGNKILMDNPNVNFAAVYNIKNSNDGGTTFSLRSSDNHNDVSKIAKMYGGNGHRNAAGMKIEAVINKFPAVTIGNCNWVKNLNKLEFTRVEGNEGRKLLVVVFYATDNKLNIGTYFLQNKVDSQNVVAIAKNENIIVNDKIDMAIIWDCDYLENKSYITMVAAKDLQDSDWKYVVSNMWKNNSFDDTKRSFKGNCDGLVKSDCLYNLVNPVLQK